MANRVVVEILANAPKTRQFNNEEREWNKNTNPDGATSTLESRQGKLHSSSSSNVILQSMAANWH